MLLLLRRLDKRKRAKQASATKPLARIPPSIVQTVSGQSPDHTPPAPPRPPMLGSDCPATAAAGKDTQQDFPFSRILRRRQGRRKGAAVSVAVRGLLKMAERNVLFAVAGSPPSFAAVAVHGPVAFDTRKTQRLIRSLTHRTHPRSTGNLHVAATAPPTHAC
jgi:hypothetical protein